jgi:hypothetical protein
MPIRKKPFSLAPADGGAIAAGVSLFALARRMGTSLEMIDKTYGHLAPDADEYELSLLDTFDARVSPAVGHLSDTSD